ncbi:condensation domain-containing protein [Amycolatopsis sp. NBC_00345]|uniref:condensation domain-containing protein n=1 Tax=Amycolatopsis sp. NBC_00345 TaxID=2975955 RepID=UPI002E267196
MTAPEPLAQKELPLSALQEAMWVSWQVEPERWVHLVPLTLAVRGELDLDRLREAVAVLCARYPMFTGRVVVTPEGTRLTWADAPAIPFVVTDGDEQAVHDARRRPIDLAQGPLARVEVVRGREGVTVVFTVHHLVLDGASIPPVLDDLSRAYRGERLGEPDDVAPFADYARRSWELAVGAEGAPMRAFWRSTLSGAAPARPLPAHQGSQGAPPVVVPVPAGLVAEVKRTARELGVTYFTMMYGALFAAVHHHSGADDLIVSTAHHGRRGNALSEQVGSFAGLLPIRQRMRDSDTYRELAQRLSRDLRAATAHGGLPLAAILRAADLVGPEARDRVSDVVLTYWNTAAGPHDVRHLDFGPAELDLVDATNASDQRLTVLLQEDGSGSSLIWQDHHGTLGAGLLSALADDHLTMVAEMTADPGRTLAQGRAGLHPSRAAGPAAAPVPAAGAAPRKAPDTHQEVMAALAQVWCETLGVASVDPLDSFFLLGGHSLLASAVVHRINERLGVTVSVRDLFAHSVLGDLAEVVARAPKTAEAGTAQARAGTVFRASRFQEGIWLAERLDPEHARYHIPLSWTVSGHLEPETLRSALTLLTTRHQILRARFVDEDGLLYQETLPAHQAELDTADLSGLSAVDRAERLAEWPEQAGRSLDPTRGRLLRAGLFDVAEGGQVLALCAHHLVLDGESVPLLLRELELCHRLATGRARTAPPPAQYHDRAEAEVSAEDLAHWRKRLDGAPGSLALTGPAEPEPHGAVTIPLAEGTTAALLPVRLERKVSGFMIAAASVAAVLHRWSGQDDLTFGIPVATRGGPGAGEVIGPRLNTLVLRSRAEPATTLADLLDAVRESVIDAFEYQDVPLESVVRELRPSRLPGRTPYVDVMVNNVGVSRWSARLGPARLTPVNFVSRAEEVSKFPITVTFTETSEALLGTLSYRGDQVSAAEAQRVAHDIGSVLSGFAEHLSTPVSKLDFAGVRS